MHTAIEVAVLVISVLSGLVVFSKSLAAGRSILALAAWIPVWLGTYLLWKPFTGHYANGSYLTWWFILILVVGVIIYLASKSRFSARLVRVLGLILLVVSLLNVDWTDVGTYHGDDQSQSQESTENPGPQKSPADCDGYNVVFDKNEGDRLVSKGVSGTPEEVRKTFLDYGKHDPRILQLAVNASPLGKVSPVDNWNSLVDDGCYTQQARDLYQQTSGAYLAAKVEPSTAPANGVNTGVTPGGSGFQEPGVYGDDKSRKATKVTFTNGDVVYIMHRCGNIVTKKPIPKVPHKPKPKPKPKCPNGSPMNPNGTCAKDPTKDVNVNPSVPPGVRGPGTTPVGTNPGPATQTYDTPTGCNGPCPRPSGEPKPSPSPTDRPQGDPDGGSGNGGATPGPGPTDDRDSGQTTSPQPSASDCPTGNPDDCP